MLRRMMWERTREFKPIDARGRAADLRQKGCYPEGLSGLSKQVIAPKVGVTGNGHRNESENTPGSAGENALFLWAGWSAVQSQAAGSGRGVVWLSSQGGDSRAGSPAATPRRGGT